VFEHYRQAIEGLSRHLGADHPLTLGAKQALAVAQQALAAKQPPPDVQLAGSASKGRAAAGTAVASEQTASQTTHGSRGVPNCAFCNQPAQAGMKLFKCSACKSVRYCSKECQAQHWKAGGHKQECKRLAAIASPDPADRGGLL
jgi:hypothetical protein